MGFRLYNCFCHLLTVLQMDSPPLSPTHPASTGCSTFYHRPLAALTLKRSITPAGEEIRWTAQSKEFDNQIQRLTGDCAIASGFVSYLGPFNKEFRELLMTRDFYGDCIKLNVPVTQNIEVAKFLVDDSEVGEWVLQGLPTDELSIQNGIMVTRAARYPVLVDPQVGAPSPHQPPSSHHGRCSTTMCHATAPALGSPPVNEIIPAQHWEAGSKSP
jgi:hypothetical protein